MPNYGSTQARLGGESWFHLDLPRHIFHFTRPTLERLLRNHGFEIERYQTGQWEMDPFGLVQTVLNRMGLRHNGLFDTLMASDSKGGSLCMGAIPCACLTPSVRTSPLRLLGEKPGKKIKV